MSFDSHRPSSDSAVLNPRVGTRFGLALRITVEGVAGMERVEGETHDISESGILFETAAQPVLGSRLALTLRWSLDGQEFAHRCHADVIRIERVGAKANVAARLLSPLD